MLFRSEVISQSWRSIINPSNNIYELLWNIHDINKLVINKYFGKDVSNQYIELYKKNKLIVYLIDEYKKIIISLKEIGQVYTKITIAKNLSKLIFNMILM